VKECPNCGRQLPLSEFGIRTNGKPQHWCRVCHRSYQRSYYLRHKTYYVGLQNERVERNRQMIRQAKAVPCADCGQRYPPYVMDFDHRPGEKKCFNLSIAAGQTRLSWKKMMAEIAKCDIVCANCHRQRTYQRKQRKAGQVVKGRILLDEASCCCSSVVEHFIGNEEVLGSTPSSSS
jgi:transposase-like protein